MPTTNYSLPTILGTNAFDLVTDYNALANATDAALANMAGLIPTETITEMEGQISALQTLTGSQGTQITTLQSQMSTANGNISTLQSGLEAANGNIGTLQTGLQSANSELMELASDVNTLNNAFVLTNTTYNGINIAKNVATDSVLKVFINSSKTIINIFGRIVTTASVQRTQIPGTNYYGLKTNVNTGITQAYVFDNSGTITTASSKVFISTNAGTFAIGNDGYIYLYYSNNANNIEGNTQINIWNSVKIIGAPADFTVE